MTPSSRLLVLVFACVVALTTLCSPIVADEQQHSPPVVEENLLRSIALGEIDTAFRLLAQGHNPNIAERPSGWTPLIHAANAGNYHLTRALLAAGALVNTGCADGWTPIMFAAVRGHVEVMRLLLENRADILLVASSGATALGSAKLGGSAAAVKLVEETLSAARLHEVIFEQEQGIEAVILAASFAGDHLLVQRLLREGHSPNTVSSGGWTPLMLAAAGGGSLPTLQALLSSGADLDRQDADGWSALMFCAHSSNLPCLELLLRAGADSFLLSKAGASVLGLARAEGHQQAFNLIVGATYCGELLAGRQVHVDAMVRDGVNAQAIDCSGARRVLQEQQQQQGAAEDLL